MSIVDAAGEVITTTEFGNISGGDTLRGGTGGTSHRSQMAITDTNKIAIATRSNLYFFDETGANLPEYVFSGDQNPSDYQSVSAYGNQFFVETDQGILIYSDRGEFVESTGISGGADLAVADNTIVTTGSYAGQSLTVYTRNQENNAWEPETLATAGGAGSGTFDSYKAHFVDHTTLYVVGERKLGNPDGTVVKYSRNDFGSPWSEEWSTEVPDTYHLWNITSVEGLNGSNGELIIASGENASFGPLVVLTNWGDIVYQTNNDQNDSSRVKQVVNANGALAFIRESSDGEIQIGSSNSYESIAIDRIAEIDSNGHVNTPADWTPRPSRKPSLSTSTDEI